MHLKKLLVLCATHKHISRHCDGSSLSNTELKSLNTQNVWFFWSMMDMFLKQKGKKTPFVYGEPSLILLGNLSK